MSVGVQRLRLYASSQKVEFKSQGFQRATVRHLSKTKHLTLNCSALFFLGFFFCVSFMPQAKYKIYQKIKDNVASKKKKLGALLWWHSKKLVYEQMIYIHLYSFKVNLMLLNVDSQTWRLSSGEKLQLYLWLVQSIDIRYLNGHLKYASSDLLMKIFTISIISLLNNSIFKSIYPYAYIIWSPCESEIPVTIEMMMHKMELLLTNQNVELNSTMV